jgi:hypothetical protein
MHLLKPLLPDSDDRDMATLNLYHVQKKSYIYSLSRGWPIAGLALSNAGNLSRGLTNTRKCHNKYRAVVVDGNTANGKGTTPS